MAKKMLTVAEVRKDVDVIRELLSQPPDHEGAHSAECRLFEKVLKAITEGRCENPVLCSKTALKVVQLWDRYPRPVDLSE